MEEPNCENTNKNLCIKADSLKCTNALTLTFSGLGFGTIQCIHLKTKC